MSGSPSLRTLAGFQAVVRTGSVTGAARELGLTQPAMSRLLAQFERSIGFRLFYRDRGRLLPTRDALVLLEEVDLALAGVARVEKLIDDIAQYRVGQLRLVAPPSLSEGVIPPIAARFLARYPEVHLTIDSRSVDTLLAMIATRAVDGGFVKLPFARSDLDAELVVKSGTMCVLPAAHPLAVRGELDAAALRDVPLILLGLGRSSRMHIEAAFEAAGVRPHVRIDTHTVGSACAFAAAGMGIAIVGELLARPYLREGLVMRPFVPYLPHAYAFATAAGIAPSRLASKFVSEVRAYFAEAGH